MNGRSTAGGPGMSIVNNLEVHFKVRLNSVIDFRPPSSQLWPMLLVRMQTRCEKL